MTTDFLTPAQQRFIPYLFAADPAELRSVDELTADGTIVLVSLVEHLRQFGPYEPTKDDEGWVIVLNTEDPYVEWCISPDATEGWALTLDPNDLNFLWRISPDEEEAESL